MKKDKSDIRITMLSFVVQLAYSQFWERENEWEWEPKEQGLWSQEDWKTSATAN